MAGIGESCKHLAALLHYIEQEVKHGHNKTCTSKVQCWGKSPPSKKRKIHERAKISDNWIEGANLDDDETEHLTISRSKFDPRPVPDRTSSFTQQDWENLAKASNANCTLLGFIPTAFVQQMNANLEKQDQLPELVENIRHDYPFSNLKEKCTILKEKMILSSDECSAVKEATIQQHKTSKWEDYRLGRIAASKAHEVITKYDDNLNIKNVKAAENLCADICDYKKKVDVKPMQWGRQNEPKARNKYRKEFKGNHKSFTCKESGLVISSLYPYLAAGPYGEVHCKCHGDGLYEVKCPWKHRNKTMKEYVAQGDSFLVTDNSFFTNIVRDILNRAFQFVGLGDISADKVEEVSSTKPFQLSVPINITPRCNMLCLCVRKHGLSCLSSQREFFTEDNII